MKGVVSNVARVASKDSSTLCQREIGTGGRNGSLSPAGFEILGQPGGLRIFLF
jgi:hypothetical protein